MTPNRLKLIDSLLIDDLKLSENSSNTPSYLAASTPKLANLASSQALTTLEPAIPANLNGRFSYVKFEPHVLPLALPPKFTQTSVMRIVKGTL